ncbi:MAG: hypothetical protein RLZZ597_1985 [Cyanobacteriota bacterium]|jgi:hypothetical protein
MSTVSLALRYGLRLDASEAFIQGYVDGMRLDQRGQGVACGKGWIPRSKKCSRDKATATPKEAKARTAEKARERAKLKGEVKAAKGQKPRDKEKPEPKQDPAKLQKVNTEFSRRVTDVATEYLKEANNAKPRQGEIAIGARHVELESMGDSLLTFSRTLAETGDVGKAEAAGMEVANSWAKNWQRNVKGTMSASGGPKGNPRSAAFQVEKAARLARESQKSGKAFSMPSDIQGSERVGMENRAKRQSKQQPGKTRSKTTSQEEFDKKYKEERKQRRTATKKATSGLSNPKPADPEKMEKFSDAFLPKRMTAMTLSSKAGMEERRQFFQDAMEGKKFKSQEIEIVGLNGSQKVNAKVEGDLAIVPLKDINLNPNAAGKRTGYSITHIPSGMQITASSNGKEARAIASALLESGIDWSGNPQKLARQERESLADFLTWTKNGVKLDSSDISLAEALYG